MTDAGRVPTAPGASAVGAGAEQVVSAHSGDAPSRWQPGPWGIGQTVDHLWIGQERRDGSLDQIVVSIEMHRDFKCEAKERALANAHLIASAPDMVDALEAASWLLADLSPDGLVKAKVDAALAKARGDL